MKSKLKLFLSIEKEEKWLNQKLSNGQQLTAVPGELFYQFEPIEIAHNDKIIQLDYRKFSDAESFAAYCQFMADTGWRHIWGSADSGTQYFIGSIHENPTFFSDSTSRIDRKKRIRNGLLKSIGLFLIVYIVLFHPSKDLVLLLHPERLFHTAGLWQRTGFSFVTAFLLELPIAGYRSLLHFGMPIALLAGVVLLGYLQYSIWREEDL